MQRSLSWLLFSVFNSWSTPVFPQYVSAGGKCVRTWDPSRPSQTKDVYGNLLNWFQLSF